MLNVVVIPVDIQGHKTNRILEGINELNVQRRRSFNRRVAQRLGSCNSTPVSPNDPLRLRSDLFSSAWHSHGPQVAAMAAEGQPRAAGSTP